MFRLVKLATFADAYRHHQAAPVAMLLAVFALVALAVAGYYWWNNWRKPGEPRDDGEALFSELCSVHELSSAERTLLAHLARVSGSRQPASLFVDPWSLDQAAALEPDTYPCQAIRRKLFGTLDP